MALNLERIYYEAKAEITSRINSTRQEMDFTGYFRIGDVIEIAELDQYGNVLSSLGLVTVQTYEKDAALIFDQAVDTTNPVGTPWAIVHSIANGQSAIDRLYHTIQSVTDCEIQEPILSQVDLVTFDVNDIGVFRIGDRIRILHDGGTTNLVSVVDLVHTGGLVNSGQVVIDSPIDISAFTNARFQIISPICTDVANLKHDVEYLQNFLDNDYLKTVMVGTENGQLTGQQRVFVNTIRGQILAASDRSESIIYADFGLPTQRITRIDYAAPSIGSVIARKTISYSLIGFRYRRDSITWSLV